MNCQKYLEHGIFKIVAACAEKLDVKAYVIGGYVRDHLMVREKEVKDIDIVVDGSGIALAQAVASYDGVKRKIAIFKRFGTAMIKVDGVEIEFVGARKESYRADSRNPIVEDGTLQDDQQRRDFTINAMSISLNKSDYGALVDPFNGIDDLKNKTIRTPLDPDVTYADDPLRMMRAVRFATQLNFQIDARSIESLATNKDRIKIITKERIIDELNKIILSPVPSIGFKLLFNAGILQHIFPKFCELHGVEIKNGKAHKDNFYHTLQVLDNTARASNDLWLRWAAIMHDIAKPDTKRYNNKVGWTFHGHEDLGARMVPRLFKQLKLPLDAQMKFVQKLVRLHLRPIALVKDVVTDSGIRRLLFDAGDDLEALMILCNADITSKNEKKVQRYVDNFILVEKKLKLIEEKDQVRNFQPPITGELIMTTFGLSPCKQIGDLKKDIKEAILEGVIKNDPEEAFQYLLEKGKEMGLQRIS